MFWTRDERDVAVIMRASLRAMIGLADDDVVWTASCRAVTGLAVGGGMGRAAATAIHSAATPPWPVHQV